MPKKSILSFVGSHCPDETFEAAIEAVRNADAHLSVTVLDAVQPIHTYAYGLPYGGVGYTADWQADIEATGKRLQEKVKSTDTLLQSAGISYDITMDYCHLSLIEDGVSRRAAVSDIIVIPEQSGLDDDVQEQIISAALYHAPVGMMCGKDPFGAAVASDRAFIAWDSSLQAANAIHKALPLLVKTKAVHIGIFDPQETQNGDGEEPGADLATWLSRHGCTVTVHQYPSGGKEIATCIQNEATHLDADLIVMGAFHHLKLRQRIFGGTTQTMLKQTKFPVLLSH